MHHSQYLLLLLVVLVSAGCNLFAVGCFGMPGWSCIYAKAPITLYEHLNLDEPQPRLENPSGTLQAEANSKILDKHEDSTGRTTHFRVRAENGETGWFAWHGNEFTGSVNSNCW